MRTDTAKRWAALAAAVLVLPGAAAPPAPVRYDLIVRNGTVFDGTGAPGRRADVGILGDRIVAVGDLRDAAAATAIDAAGRYVSPGFVSIHDHSAPEAYARPVGLLTQGVTTAIANPDGRGPLDLAAQLDRPAGLGLNYGGYIGFNSVWQEVMGFDDRRPSPAEITRMRGLIEAGMRQGAFGVSAGLDYKPGYWAKTAEVEAVVSAARGWRTNFPNHERVYIGNGYSSLVGMRETLDIARAAGLAGIITHMKLQGGDRGKTAPLFAMMADTARRGTIVAADAYPYTYGSTALEQLLIPSWAQEGGRAAMLARFKDPALRPRIVAETIAQMNARWTGPGGVYLPDMKQELTAVMQSRGLDAGEAVVRLLEEGHTQVLLRYGTEEDLVRILRYPDTAVSCDCGAQTTIPGHPRHWGSYPRFLGRYVREQRIMSWAEAVRRMTALPAGIVGLTERGYLRPGMIADVTIFDPGTVIDRSTLDRPTAPSIGISDVIVNGRLALAGGTPTGAVAGARLIRSPHEPSRVMALDRTRGVRIAGRFGTPGRSVVATLRQIGGHATATGEAQVPLADGSIVRFRPDLIQASDGWAVATGVATIDGGPHAVTLWAETSDPRTGAPGVAVAVDGRIVLDATGGEGRVAVTLARPTPRRKRA